MGDCLLVELLKEEEFKTKSGLIIAAGPKNQVNGLDANRPLWVRVLMVGEGFYDDEGKTLPLETRPGDIVLIGKNSVEIFSVFGRLTNYGDAQLGLVRDSEVRMRFRGQEGFDKFFEIANGQA